MKFLRQTRLHFQSNHLSKKLFLSYVFFCFVPLALMGWIVIVTSFHLLTEQAEESVEVSILQTEQNIETVLSFYERLSENYIYDSSLANAISRKYESSSQLIDTYHNLWKMRSNLMKANLDLRNITIYTHNGTMVEVPNYLLKMPEDVLRDSSQMSQWFGFSNCLVHPHTEDRMNSICYIRSFHISDSNNAILCFEIRTEPLYELIHLEGANKQIFILDHENRIITSSENDALGEPIQSVLQLDSDFLGQDSIYNGKLDQDRRIWMLPLQNGWKVCAVASLNAVLEKANAVKFFCLLGMVAVVVADVMLILFFTRLFMNRINKVIDKIQKFDYHNLEPGSAIGGADEVAMIDSIFTHMAYRIDSQIQEAALLQSQKKDAEMKALQARINPHFLYNTLSVIGWMTDTHSPHDVKEAISMCATYYRATLSSGRDIISLSEELEGLKAYLDLRKIRAVGRIHVFYNVDSMFLSLQIPKMTLQPIVENSLQHGIGEGKETIVLQISAEVIEEDIVITVEDDGIGMTEDQLKKLKSGELTGSRGGYGFANVCERLALHFGTGFHVAVTSVPFEKTVVSFHIPLQCMVADD